jgi:hypothetical protein
MPIGLLELAFFIYESWVSEPVDTGSEANEQHAVHLLPAIHH